jgi:hypothetical protein
MQSIATKVEQIVSESSFLTEGIALGLINLSELARQMRPQLEADRWKSVGQAAVVMALRRLTERAGPPGEPQPVTLAPHMGELTTRTELALVTYSLSEHSDACRRKLLALAERYPDSFVSVTHGVHEMLVVCSRALLPLMETAFHGEREVAQVANVTALTLRLKPETVNTPGIYHAVLKNLAWNKISMVTMMCTLTEMTMLLEPPQTAPAFAVLSQIMAR